MLKKSNGPCGDNILLTRSSMWHFGGTVGKKQFSTIPILYNYMLMNQLVNLTQHFVDFDGGQDQQHWLQLNIWSIPKSDCTALAILIRSYIFLFQALGEKSSALYKTTWSIFFLIQLITCEREEIKSKWIYILQRTHQRMYQKAHVDRQSLFSHALLFCLTCQEESSVLSTKPLERQTSHKPQKPNFPKRS